MPQPLKLTPRGKTGILQITGTYKGHHVRLSSKTSDYAEGKKVLNNIIQAIDEGLFHGELRITKFSDLVDQYLSHSGNMSDSSILTARRFKTIWGHRSIGSIRPTDALQYIEDRRKAKVADSTIAREIRQAQAVLNFADRMDWVTKAVRLPRPSEDNERCRWETVDTIDELAKAASSHSEKIGDLIVLLAHTGARLGEVLGLTSRDFVLDDDGVPSAVTLRSRKGRKKKERLRTVPLNKRAKEVVLKYWPITNNHGLLITATGNNGTAWTYNSGRSQIRKVWDTACQETGIEDFRIHDLRHCFASWAAMNGANELVLMKLLGHTKAEMVRRYAHLNAEALLSKIHFD